MKTKRSVRNRRAKAFQLKDGSFKGKGLQSVLSWREIRSMIYKGRGE